MATDDLAQFFMESVCNNKNNNKNNKSPLLQEILRKELPKIIESYQDINQPLNHREYALDSDASHLYISDTSVDKCLFTALGNLLVRIVSITSQFATALIVKDQQYIETHIDLHMEKNRHQTSLSDCDSIDALLDKHKMLKWVNIFHYYIDSFISDVVFVLP